MKVGRIMPQRLRRGMLRRELDLLLLLLPLLLLLLLLLPLLRMIILLLQIIISLFDVQTELVGVAVASAPAQWVPSLMGT